MDLESVMIEAREGGYGFDIFPMLRSGEELVLSKNKAGENVINTGNADQELVVDKSRLEELSYAYVFVKNGKKYGAPVKILTRPPAIRRILLQSEGRVKLVPKGLNQYTGQAGLELVFTQGNENRGEVRLGSGVFEFDLAKAGIVFDEKIKVDVQIRFCLVNENQTVVFGPVLNTVMVINPPAVKQIVREEKKIILRLSEKPAFPLYAKFYRDGQEICGTLQCIGQEEPKASSSKTGVEYMIRTDTFNLNGGFYALSLACMSEQTVSYWSVPIPIISDRPIIRSVRFDGKEWIIRLQEKGYYCWQDKYEWTDQIQTSGDREPEIRYADQCGDTVSLGPVAKITGTSENCFVVRDGSYCREGRDGSRSLAAKYAPYDNESFRIEEKDGIWHLVIKEGYHETVGQDFEELLIEECASYAQIEELSECFGEMLLKPEDMLAVRYGYRPDQGACDIRAGMMLCFHYEQYQNIPEVDRWTVSVTEQEVAAGTAKEAETISDRNLSGFTGSGSSVFCSILRDGAVTFEPFAKETVQVGRMTIIPPQIEQDGRTAMAAGIWDTLFVQAPFVKLLYPAQWRQSGHLNHGSMYYYDNVCLVAADSYAKMQEAVEQFQEQSRPSEDAAYVCFRGRTEVKLMIHIYVEGHPQVCALGTTLGDIISAYGMGRNVLLERLYGERYIPFVDTNAELPLYIGDRICSR